MKMLVAQESRGEKSVLVKSSGTNTHVQNRKKLHPRNSQHIQLLAPTAEILVTYRYRTCVYIYIGWIVF